MKKMKKMNLLKKNNLVVAPEFLRIARPGPFLRLVGNLHPKMEMTISTP
jgi:hypothetical protein